MYGLIDHIIYPLRGHGKLGGKSAGLFLAQQILRHGKEKTTSCCVILRFHEPGMSASNTLLEFMGYNNLRDLYFRKYMDIEHVRQEYPHIVHLFKNSTFPPEISRGLVRRARRPR